MSDNITSIKKMTTYPVYRAFLSPAGNVNEQEQLGMAFLKPGSKMFRLKLWLIPNSQLFVAINNDPTKCTVLCLDEYVASSGETRTRWNTVGKGELQGVFIRLTIFLLSENVYLCLFPGESLPQAETIAS